jgi:hypothetical protein
MGVVFSVGLRASTISSFSIGFSIGSVKSKKSILKKDPTHNRMFKDEEQRLEYYKQSKEQKRHSRSFHMHII